MLWRIAEPTDESHHYTSKGQKASWVSSTQQELCHAGRGERDGQELESARQRTAVQSFQINCRRLNEAFCCRKKKEQPHTTEYISTLAHMGEQRSAAIGKALLVGANEQLLGSRG